MYKQSSSGSGNNKEPPSFKSKVKTLIKDSLSKNPKLEKFLEENNAKGRFIRACTNNAYGVSHGWNAFDISYICENIKESETPIMNCFTWSNTTEKREFWRKLEDKYQNRETKK